MTAHSARRAQAISEPVRVHKRGRGKRGRGRETELMQTDDMSTGADSRRCTSAHGRRLNEKGRPTRDGPYSKLNRVCGRNAQLSFDFTSAMAELTSRSAVFAS